MIYFLSSFFALIFFCQSSYGSFKNPFSVSPELNPNRPRDFIFPPIESFFLPGFDQYLEHQTPYGLTYSGIYIVGFSIEKGSPDYRKFSNFHERLDCFRVSTLGNQFRLLSGQLSLYHSFRTAVESRKKQGEFSFLKYSETPQELALAPFQLKYLTSPYTYLGIPGLMIMGGLIEAMKRNHFHYHIKDFKTPTSTDVTFSGVISFNAGVGEEAFFRGWIMPVTMYYSQNEWVSNAITSLAFGIAHFGWDSMPISQTIGGFYLGYVSQVNQWTLGESIFIHTWYDVAAFLFLFSTSRFNSEFKLSPITIPF